MIACLHAEGTSRKYMINPTQVAAAVIGLMLSAAVVLVGFDLAVAGPIPAPSEAAAATPKPAGPARGALSNTRPTVAQTAVAVAPPPAADQPATEPPRGRVYLFRGALGPFFSRGMDRLTDKLEHAGFTASVDEFTICRLIAAKAIREYREDPAPITLIGHSMGGYCTVKFAEILQEENIPVSLVVAIDPAHVTPSVPLNVERFINIFLSTSVLGGGDVKPSPGYQGHYASFDLSEHDEVSHINIEKMDQVHAQLITKIAQLVKTPAKGAGETIPLRYVVPANAEIELWDSGMPVIARAGDTLQSIAASYQLPLWALTQMNKGADNAPLVPGERIIVPRHLLPLAEVSAHTPPKH
jgi:LysM repeat protein